MGIEGKPFPTVFGESHLRRSEIHLVTDRLAKVIGDLVTHCRIAVDAEINQQIGFGAEFGDAHQANLNSLAELGEHPVIELFTRKRCSRRPQEFIDQ